MITKRIITIITLAFLLFFEFFPTIDVLATETVQAQINTNQNTISSQDSSIDGEDEDSDYKPDEVDSIIEFKAALDDLEDVGLPQKIVLDPFDQNIFDLYIDPDKAFQKLSQPGSDRAAFETLVQDQFGLKPSLKEFSDSQKLYDKLVSVLINEDKLNHFISALQQSLNKGFVTETNKTIVEAILQIAKDAKGLNPKGSQPEATPEIASAARRMIDEFTKIFTNVQDGTPVLATLFRAIEVLPLDERIVNTLVYLVTPRAQGGAGHERIKIQRIWKDYATDKDAKSKETKNADNTSAHHTGQAIDISEIDNVKCTLYKSGWIKRKKEERPPIPIKVSFQSEDTLANTPEGKSNLPLGFSSMFDVLKDTSLNNILDGFTDLDIDNLQDGSLKDAGLSDILKVIGEQLVLQAAGLQGGTLGGFNFNDVVAKVGQAYLADKLGIPRYAFKGSDLENELEPNIGRADLEERLHLPPNSLKGETTDQILASIGARKIEQSLNLRSGTLSLGATPAIIGQGYIEQALNLTPGTFSYNTIDPIRTKLGSYKFKTVFEANPEYVDDQIKAPKGSTKTFLESGNADIYKQAVGKRIVDGNFKTFVSYKEKVLDYVDKINTSVQELRTLIGPPRDSLNRPTGNEIAELVAMDKIINDLLYQPANSRARGSAPQKRLDITPTEVKKAAQQIGDQIKSLNKKLINDEAAKKILANTSNPDQVYSDIQNIQFNADTILRQDIGSDLTRVVSQRDQVFSTPQGSLEALMSGNTNSLIEIGKQELANHLSYSSFERQEIVDWFSRGASTPLGAVEGVVTSALGVSRDDVARFFATGSKEVLKNIGEQRLIKGVLNLDESKKFQQDFLRDHPELQKIYDNISFRTDRLRDIKGNINSLNRLVSTVDQDNSARQQIDKAISSPAQIESAIRQVGILWDRLDRSSQIQTNQQAQSLMNQLQTNFRALVNGQYSQSLSSISASALGANQNNSFGLNLTANDVFDLISKRRSPLDVMQVIGFRALEGGIGLPPESLYLFSQASQKSPENFFASVGQAKLNEIYGKGDTATIISKNSAGADRQLGLKNGTTSAFLGRASNSGGGTIDIGQQSVNAYNLGNSAGVTDGAEQIEGQEPPTPNNPGPSYNQSEAASTLTGLSYKRGYADGLAGVNNPPANTGSQMQTPPSNQTGQVGQIKISSNQYLQEVGRQTIIFSSIRRITGNLQIDGLTFGPDDIYSLVTGGAQDVFSRVAGYQLDQQLRLFPGTIRSIVAARNNQERDDSIAIAGGAYLGNLLGIGPIDFRTGNPTFATGANIIENTLGMREGSVRKSNNLTELKSADPNAQTKLFGNSDDDIKRTDRLLRLSVGTTQKLRDGVISLGDYARQVGIKNLEYQFVDSRRTTGLIMSLFGIERDRPRDQHEQDMISLLDVIIPKISHTLIDGGDLGKSLGDWSPQDRRTMFSALDDMFGLELDRRTRMAPGTWANVIANPDQARQIILGQGMNSIDQQFDLGGKLTLAYNFYALKKIGQTDQENQRTVVVNQVQGQDYQSGYSAGQKYLAEHPKKFKGTVFDDVTGEAMSEDFDTSDFDANKPSNSGAGPQYQKGFDDAINNQSPQVVTSEAVSDNRPSSNAGGFFNFVKQQTIDNAQYSAADQLKQAITQAMGVNISTTDLLSIAQGDIRAFQYIGMAEAFKQFQTFAGAQNLPQKYQVTYSDLKNALVGNIFEDQDQVDLAGIVEEKKWKDHFAAGGTESTEFLINWLDQNYPPLPSDQNGPNVPRDQATAQALFIAAKSDEAKRDEASQLRQENQQFVQYKLMDIAAYQVNHNIPPGFTQAFMNGDGKQRFNSFLDFVQNSIKSGIGFDLPPETLSAVAKYFEGDRSEQLFSQIPQTAFGAMESFVNSHRLIGFDLPQGSMYALFHFAQTQNLNELLPVGSNGNAPTLGAVLGKPIFGWADKTFGLPGGSSLQIAQLAFGMQSAQAAVKSLEAVDALGESTQLANAKEKLANLKGALVSFVVTTVFQKQLLDADKALGLVPGSMGILVGYTSSLAATNFAAFNPVTLAITLVIFFAINLFGFNRTQLLCTGDGYYPRIGALDKDLTLDLPVFDGMSPTSYRQGLLQAAQKRVRGLIEDLLEMPYHFDEDGNIIPNILGGKSPTENMKPVQIITRRPEDYKAFFGNPLYVANFGEAPPSNSNRQGILTGSDYFVDAHIHIGF